MGSFSKVLEEARFQEHILQAKCREICHGVSKRNDDLLREVSDDGHEFTCDEQLTPWLHTCRMIIHTGLYTLRCSRGLCIPGVKRRELGESIRVCLRHRESLCPNFMFRVRVPDMVVIMTI